jgi:hypothetical protein
LISIYFYRSILNIVTLLLSNLIRNWFINLLNIQRKNLGSADLALSGIPRVSIEGFNASIFSVGTQPASLVSAGGSTTVTITGIMTTPEPEFNIKQCILDIPFRGTAKFGSVVINTQN